MSFGDVEPGVKKNISLQNALKNTASDMSGEDHAKFKKRSCANNDA